MSLIKGLYNTATLLVPPIFLRAFLFHKRGRGRLWERYGFWGAVPSNVTWFHAASVGEWNGLLPLVRCWKDCDSTRSEIFCTAVSATGLERVGEYVSHKRLFPFDNVIWFRHLIEQLAPRVVVIAETEIWPGFLSELNNRSIPCFIVNGRISDQSFGKYTRFKSLFNDSLVGVRGILAADSSSAERFKDLGACPDRVWVFGNTKYDREPTVKDDLEKVALQERTFFENPDPVIVFGSVRTEELMTLLEGAKVAWDSGLKFKLVLAPRHLEKLSYFSRGLQTLGLRFGLWSQGPCSERIIVLDVLGVLEKTYSISCGAFIGGSLCNVGGHNPLEAAAYGVPVAMGPFRQNIREVAERLVNAEALTTVTTVKDVERFIQGCVNRDLASSGLRAKKVWESLSGVTERVVKFIQRELQK